MDSVATNKMRLFRRLAALVCVFMLVAATALAAVKVGSIKGSVSNQHPKRHTNVTAYATVKDGHGKAIGGCKVVFTWHYKTTTPVVTAHTNSKGVASCTRNISSATVGYKVVINEKATSGGVSKSTSTSFTPKK